MGCLLINKYCSLDEMRDKREEEDDRVEVASDLFPC